MNSKKGLLVILSAPSGCGKDTVFKELYKMRTDCVESISATTREPRQGEVDGVNYFFKTNEDFEDMIKNNQLLEYANYNNCYYGTPIEGVQNAINNGKICFLIIEVQGAKNVMKMMPEAVSIFLLPPSIESLKHRLSKRGTESQLMIDNRIALAQNEIDNASFYKYKVVNDELEKAVEEINNILNNELEAQNN